MTIRRCPRGLHCVKVRNGWYDQYEGAKVGDPNLWSLLPSGGMIDGRGSLAPEDWSTSVFLGAIEDAVVD